MDRMESIVRARRSVRTFDGRPLSREDLEKLRSCMEDIPNPYGLPIEFRFLSSREHKLSCPVAVGTELYVGGKMKIDPECCVAFGYSFEKLVLYAQSLGIGTVWIGGTMDRGGFERAMELGDGEIMPAVSPVGYPAERMSLRETMMRKGIRAGERMAFEELFFRDSFSAPMSKDEAGELAFPLEMVRLGPSAVNKQPWRVLIQGNRAHFYLKRSRAMGGSLLDMQKLDMGIALCHFESAAGAAGLEVSFLREAPEGISGEGLEYIASYGW